MANFNTMGKEEHLGFSLAKAAIAMVLSAVLIAKFFDKEPSVWVFLIGTVAVLAILDRVIDKIMRTMKGEPTPTSAPTAPKPAPPEMQTSSEMQAPPQPKKVTDDEIFEDIVKRLGR